jgi:serine/threonine-protein kinase
MDIEQLAGTTLGNYEIESLLGRGGMGVVYKARQISLDRPVALKLLPPTLSSDNSFVKRFQREARAVAKLTHPNIIHIYDVGREKGLHYFSMEYLEGRTLDEILREKGKLDVDEAVRIISQAAHGIEHAHEHRILHRDIKPSNIILDTRGNIKVMDFGLARMAGDRSKLTQSGTLMGTLDYMSPEQCRGEELDEQTDIYSLGVVLYEMLTGRPPFDAPNEAALIHKITNEEPAAARNVNPDVPAELNAVLERSMCKYRRNRYASISELLEDIGKHKGLAQLRAVVGPRTSPSIAVLPFVNMSADPEQEYFCDGLAEELINALTQIEDLKVIARTSAFSFKGRNVNVREIGRELDVGTILEGSVRKAGNRLRITAQLVDTARGHHLWSEKYDREMKDIFAIQDEISEAIVAELKPKLLKEEKVKFARRQTVNLEAYNLYLRGRHFWNRRSEEGLNRAVECFKRAIEKAPDYATAYAGLADCHISLAMYGFLSPKDAYPKAREAALKAMEIDDAVAEAHTSLATIKYNFDWDWERAEKEYKRATELNPGYATAHHWYAGYLRVMGRSEEAIAEIERALELDPFALGINSLHAGILMHSGQYDRAIEASKKTLELDPNFPAAHTNLGATYFFKGMHEEALAAFQRAEKLQQGKAGGMIGKASVYAYMGRTGEARQILGELLELRKKQYVPAFFLAFVYFLLGEIDHGFEWLGNACEERDDWLLQMVKSPIILDFLNIHSDPRYIALLKKIGLDT